MGKIPTYEELEQRVEDLEKEAGKRKQAEEALGQKIIELDSFINNIPDMAWLKDTDSRFITVNSAFGEAVGINPESMINQTCEVCFGKERARKFREDDQQVMKTRRQIIIEEKIIDSQSNEVWLETIKSPILDESAKVAGTVGIARDISKRKQAEEALRESEEKFRNFLENLGDAAYQTDSSGKVTYANKASEIITGMPLKDIIGKPFLPLFTKESQEIAIDVYQRTLNGESPEYQLTFSNGTICSFKNEPLRDKNANTIGVFGIARDITERVRLQEALRKAHDELERRVEERTLELVEANEELKREIEERNLVEGALRDTEERYALATRAARVGVWDWNVQTGKFFLDPNVKAILGYYDEEIPNDLDVWATYVHPDDKQPVMKAFQAHLEGKTPEFLYEHRMLHKDGSVRWILARGTAMRDAHDDPTRVVGTDVDITLRKQAEEALRESEDRYRTVLEANPDSVVVYDIEGKVVYFNRAFTHLFGWTLEERLGKKMDIFVPEENWSETQMMIDKIKAGDRFSGIERQRFTKSGNVVDVSISGAVYRDRNAKPVGSIVTLRDISEEKLLKAQLTQAEKMEAVGTLAGGIAHDFNNLLMAIQGRTSLMLMKTDSSHPHFEHLSGIEEYVSSAADLTKQLLAFARGGKYEVKPTDLNELIEKSSRMLARAKKEIKIHTKYQKVIWTVEVDQRQIEQALLNLYVNAWQAMPGGGELYIQTENLTLDEDYVKPFTVKSGKYVKISVTDTGVGMDQKTKERIFDPFFTTKEISRGTGLGLSSAYGIIKNHGGIIDVYSKKGKGTTFNIYLPASEKEVLEEKELPKDILRGTETALLVDDEDMIIDVGRLLLENLGYKVVVAKSGREAIDTYKKNMDKIDIVILDMIMPDMGGGETYDRMKVIDPDIKVLLSSGYSINGQAQKILDRGCSGFIQKPFTMKDLSERLRQILDKN